MLADGLRDAIERTRVAAPAEERDPILPDFRDAWKNGARASTAGRALERARSRRPAFYRLVKL
jgi:hypothetical protein